MTPASTSTTTCAAITTSGARCKRRPAKGSLFCRQHEGIAGAVGVPPLGEPNGAASGSRRRTSSASSGPGKPGVGSESAFSSLRQFISDNVAAGYGGIENEQEYADILAELADSASGAKSEVRGFVDELQEMLSEAGTLIERVSNMLQAAGIITPGQVDEFATDMLAAAGGLSRALNGRLTGDFDEDDFGFDEKFTEALVPVFQILYRWYWRVEALGLENLPAEGPALLVSNHAGAGVPFDGAMIKCAIRGDDRINRHARMLVHDWAMSVPYLGTFMRRTGQVLACNENATALLQRGHIVGVFPEGIRGMVKPYTQRYQLQRFGRGGFVRIALETGAPIIPVAVVGSEEIYPKIANMPFVNRLIGAPFVPVTPTFPLLGLLGLLPLPSKWIIEFGEAIDVTKYGEAAIHDRALVLELGDRIRTTIQQTLDRNLRKRSTPFW